MTKISVIVPVKDRAKTIGRTISSVSGSRKTEYELIVIDDGSSDNTVEVARSAIAKSSIKHAQIISQPNAGPGAARNAGAARARGEYLAFLDSDDYWFPWTLECCLEAVEDSRGAVLMFMATVDVPEGTPEPIAEGGEVSTTTYPGFLEAVAAAPSFRFGAGCAVMRRKLFQQLGGFTTRTHCAEDTDLFLRASNSGPCKLIQAPLLVACKVSQDDGLTSNFDYVRAGLEHLLAQNLAGNYNVGSANAQLLNRFFAKSVVYTVRKGFSLGHSAHAYRVFFANLVLLLRGGAWHWLIRLPFYPALHLLKPSSYPLRRR